MFVGAGAGPVASLIFSTFTAAFLKTGCLETGSHSVSVSSLAAVGCSPVVPSRSQ